jgi:hypothetical protein
MLPKGRAARLPHLHHLVAVQAEPFGKGGGQCGLAAAVAPF